MLESSCLGPVHYAVARPLFIYSLCYIIIISGAIGGALPVYFFGFVCTYMIYMDTAGWMRESCHILAARFASTIYSNLSWLVNINKLCVFLFFMTTRAKGGRGHTEVQPLEPTLSTLPLFDLMFF